MKWIFVAGLPVFALLSGCMMNSSPPEAIAPGVPWAVTHPPESVDPAVYLDLDDPTDPYASVYADFRARRLRDRADPEMPPALPRYPALHRTAERPWDDLEQALSFDWQEAGTERPREAEALRDAFAARLAFDHPDVKIVQMMLAPGGVLPAHAGGSPGVWIVVGGRGEITVEGETRTATPGTTVKLDPYDVRRLVAGEDEPLRVIWIRWAPGGDQAYVSAGYYMTGANMHLQPRQADMPEDYLFWGAVHRSTPVSEPTSNFARPGPGTSAGRARVRLQGWREDLGGMRDLYPDVPRWGHESGISWLSQAALKSAGFFFSKDMSRMSGIVDRMVEIARHKAIFRATRPDGNWDYNISETSWGPRSTYVEHSHLLPELYYILSGPVIYGVDGDLHEVGPGDILFNNSYAPHLAQGIVDGLVFDNFGSTWAPNGDRSVFDHPFLLLESLPAQSSTSRLGAAPSFH